MRTDRREAMKAFRRWIVWYLAAAMFVIGITPRAYAGFSPSQGIGLSQIDRSSDFQKIQKFLEMKMVRERFTEFGLTQDQIQARLDQLSDPQIHQLALKIDDLKVGGDGGTVVIVVLLIVVLVVLLILVTGHRIVVK